MFERKFKDLISKERENPVEVKIVKSGNGATKLSSTGDIFVDQFSFISQYRDKRSYSEIEKDMKKLWEKDPILTMKLTFYMRLITRDCKGLNNEIWKGQIGQGLKHESIFRLIWIEINNRKTFYKNLPILVSAGCWKDLFQMLVYDLIYNGWENRKLDWKALTDFILAGLENPNSSELVKKFLPNIKARSKTHTVESQALTIIGKYLVTRMFDLKKGISEEEKSGFYKKYRLLKSSGTAHEWQKQISQGNFDIDFNKVPGRALSLLVSGNFLKNHGLGEKYEKWVLSQPVAKFTGYVYELFKELKESTPNYKKVTINKQFEGLLNKAQKDTETKFWVVRDLSGSMDSRVRGTKIKSNDVARAMALYFSYLLPEPFNNGYVGFANSPKIYSWKGKTPCERYLNDVDVEAYGSTNFVGVANVLINLYNFSKVPIENFPNGLLIISDGEFNRTNNKTNFSTFKEKLINAGFPLDYVENLKLVLWDIPNTFYSSSNIRPKFESYSDTPNYFYMSGLDPAAISFLMTGKFREDKKTPKTPKELFDAAMNQELLNEIKL